MLCATLRSGCPGFKFSDLPPMSYRPKRPLLIQMRHLLKSGVMEKPKWFDIAMKIPPDEPRMQAGRPKYLNLPEVRTLPYTARSAAAVYPCSAQDSSTPPPNPRMAIA
jgi:hypothetical protein